MLSTRPLLIALLALSLSSARWGAAAFYMPPEFDLGAVPGYEQQVNRTDTSNPGSGTGGSSSSSSTGAYLSSSTAAGVFDVHQNATKTQPGGDGGRPGAALDKHGAPATGSGRLPEMTGAVGAAGVESSSPRARTKAAVLPRDVWSPRIIEPDADTVWTVGSTVRIVWDTSDRPHEVTNYEGRAVLGYLADGDDDNEHLEFEHPLAEGFNLTAGHVTVRVPDVDPRNEYIVVLFGDSGNRSPEFNIVN